MSQNPTVERYMTKAPVTVKPDETIRRVFELMDQGNFRHLPVTDAQGHVVGLVTERDIRTLSAALDVLHETIEGGPGQVPVSAIMTPNIVSIGPAASLGEAAKLMNEKKVGGLPVVVDGKLVGIITYTDVLRAVIEIFG